MKTKINHTPGPWRTSDLLLRVRQDKDFATAIYAGKGKQSQCVGDFVQSSVRDVASAKANARLIVAAPDFLDASNSVLQLFDEMFPDEPLFHGDKNSEPHPGVLALRAAIDKAKGLTLTQPIA